MTMQSTEERPARTGNGYVYVAAGVFLLLGGIGMLALRPVGLMIAAVVLAELLAAWCLIGLYMLQPNQAALLLLFGNYRGTDREPGLRWANPFYSKTKISVRAHNFNSEKLKVNDLRGNPIEIAAAIVWRVDDTAMASFDVEDYEAYVLTQAESAVRHLALSYAYDNFEEPGAVESTEVTLRSGTEQVSAALRNELQQRFAQAGIVVVDAKLTHLAYAPEIAGTMLRRQQAEAVIAARSKIVAGAVGMVEMALNGLADRGLVQLDDERRAAMVSNLLVVLCSDHDAQPVVNAGTLYTWAEVRTPATVAAMANPDKKAFLLRIDPALWAEIERLAAAELRSANAEVEYLLREALKSRGIGARPIAAKPTPKSTP